MSHTALAAIALTLAVVGVFGVVVPVLPGSLMVAVAMLVWAFGVHSTLGWITFGVGAVLVAIGMTSSALLTRKHLKRREIPQWPVIVGLAGGIAGAILLPGPGLLIGFVATLFVVELVRIKQVRAAASTTWVAIKAVGLGMLIELGCALLATSTLVASVLLSGP